MCGFDLIVSKLPTDIPIKIDDTQTKRGPDSTNIVKTSNYLATFYRLRIVGTDEKSNQPFRMGTWLTMCNGEIYNHTRLYKDWTTQSYGQIGDAQRNEVYGDCGVIPIGLNEKGISPDVIIKKLDGEFSTVIYNTKTNNVWFARDRLGRKPLYYAVSNDTIYVGTSFSSIHDRLYSSELIREAVPGVIYNYSVSDGKLIEETFHRFVCINDSSITNKMIMDSFINGVVKRVTQSDVPVGFLLSGGFDSSLVLSTALKYAKMPKKVPVFTTGFHDQAPDVLSAEKMVNWIRQTYGKNAIEWHKVIFKIEDGLNAIKAVIKAIETYDTTTIRASTPMYLISKYIHDNTDVRIIISGEGSDELFGGYMYFLKAPDNDEFKKEICKLLSNLYLYDNRRADRVTAANSLEVRTPFLDDTFVQRVLASENLQMSTVNTKMFIRNIVNEHTHRMLPDDILWGKKEAFSDAVGYDWKDTLAKVAASEVKNNLHQQSVAKMFDNHDIVFGDSYGSPILKGHISEISPHITPSTDEMKYFQMIFRSFFKHSWHVLPALWLPNQSWVQTGVEPSARAIDVYDTINADGTKKQE